MTVERESIFQECESTRRTATLASRIVICVLMASSFGTVSAASHPRTKGSSQAQKIRRPAVVQSGIPNTMYLKQGFDLRFYVTNFGTVGKTDLTPDPGPDSLACEYPAGSDIEHMTGGGIWVGGVLDTSTTSIPSYATAVTTAYEGWAGPREEMFPSDNPEDQIWMTKKGASKPAGWDQYWGNSLPFHPVSDEDFYCTYTDTFKTDIADHIPLHLKVIQKSYAWAGGYADAIVPLEYDVINVGTKTINSAYIGYFLDADVGPYYITTDNGYSHNFFQVNYTGYYSTLRTAYIMNPVDRGSTPIGLTLCGTPKPLDSLTYTFRWYPGPESPPNDLLRYQWMSSGLIMPNQSVSDLSDTRFLFSFGPFTINPGDTEKITIAIISGNNLDDLKNNAARALALYERGYYVPVTPPSPPLTITPGFKKVTLNWQWQPGDAGPNPETTVDDSNRLAMSDTSRRGKIFEGYRLYRSEDVGGSISSFTLLRQYDMVDQFDYNTGLQYTYTDSNLVRGNTYWYAVTSYSIPDYSIVTVKNPDGTTSQDTTLTQPLESSILSNAKKLVLPFSDATGPGQVIVVPNPYRTDADYTFENGGWEGRTVNWDETKRVIKFIHLPQVCTIRIFTLTGELVTTIEHRPGSPGYDPTDGEEDWHLLSGSNRTVASGIYVFTVDSNFGTQVGKFVIIK